MNTNKLDPLKRQPIQDPSSWNIRKMFNLTNNKQQQQQQKHVGHNISKQLKIILNIIKIGDKRETVSLNTVSTTTGHSCLIVEKKSNNVKSC